MVDGGFAPDRLRSFIERIERLDQEKQDLDEAIGDAWENLAYLDVIRRQRVDRAETYLQKSSSHYPYDQRSGVLRIRQAMNPQ